MSKKSLRASRSFRSPAPRALLEALESRTLLSAATVAAAPVALASHVVMLAKGPPVVGPISLTNSIVSSSLPGSLTFTKGSKAFKVQVNVANTGTGTTAKGAKVTVTAVLHPVSGADVTIGSKSQAYTNVVGGSGSKTVTVRVKVPTTLAAGAYTLKTSVVASGFTPTSSNVVTGSAITVSTAASGGSSFLGNLGNVIRLTALIDTQTNVLPGGFGTTTTTHWNFVDDQNHPGELFLIQNTGVVAKSADATINFFPDNALGAGSVILKGKDASAPAAVGTTFTFGKSGSISVTTDSYTHGTCKVSRTG